jgi:hypothetical protein
MDAEVVVVCGYAVGLLLLAALIRRVGEANTDAWSSRLFAAYRAQAPSPPVDDAADWPHSEAPRLYRAVAAVAGIAALVLGLMELVRHHRPPEVALELTVVVLAAAVLARWLHAEKRRQGGATTIVQW